MIKNTNKFKDPTKEIQKKNNNDLKKTFGVFVWKQEFLAKLYVL